ncbi:MAG: Serine/threonine-protein kinase StkP [bacterium ADurb.Bin425]|nr:MAG: Serine/threonine-protein kinase StkP [bacterium ADurb.Bin425]
MDRNESVNKLSLPDSHLDKGPAPELPVCASPAPVLPLSSLPLRSLQLLSLRYLLYALMPLWLFWPAYLAFSGGPLYVFAILLGTGAFALVVTYDRAIVLSDLGLRFPLRFLFEARFRLFRPFEQLVEIDFREGAYGDTSALKPEFITFVFTDGARISVRITELGRAALKNILLALSLKCPDLKYTPALKDVDLDLPIEADNLGWLHPSYTHLWEEEMSGRFSSTSFVPLRPGDSLKNGALKICAQLSFGGLAAVYLASLKGQTVVLKEAVLPAGASPALRQKALHLFRREAEILSKIKHERIVSVIDSFQEQERNYLVLEHVRGLDLRRLVSAAGPLDYIVVFNIVQEVCDIVAYLHSLSPPIVHRDLTPDNILLDSSGRAFLIDFGVSATFIGTATGTMVGKQSYISPEQFRGKACPQSDVYSLACTIFFLLTATEPEPLSRIQAESLPLAVLERLPSHIRSEIITLLSAMTEQEVSDRLDLMQVKERIKLILAGRAGVQEDG